jgi:Zn-dependent protease with chaperone function
MNFFQRQVEVRALSKRLVWLFLLAVLLVVGAVSTLLISVFAAFQTDSPQSRGLLLPDQAWLSAHSGMVLLITFGVLGVIVVASLYKTSVLSGGGGVVARAAGGVRVPTDTSNPHLRQLLNVVEEIAIASGISMPAVYLLPHETGINAFAAGFNPSNAAIAVTQGCLDLLNRDELQGVVAHEFSHIANGDMRLNIRLMGLLFGLTVIASVARTVMRLIPRGGGGGDSRKSGGALLAVFGVAVLVYVLGYIGLFFGRMIQAAVARKRESLADASAVQFTRDPHGLRNALVKIGASSSGSRLVEADADAVAHMLFAPGMARLFATHPPLEQRIKDIDPTFTPAEFAQARAELVARNDVAKPAVAPETSAVQRLAKLLVATNLNAADLPNQVGHPTEMHIEIARAIRVSLPTAIVAAANNSRDAVALMFALALDNSESVREVQLRFLAQQLGTQHAQDCQTWLGTLNQLNALQRQPTLLRLLPTLRQLPLAQRSDLLRCLNGLLQHSGRVSIEQYSLRKLAQVQLRDVSNALSPPTRTTLLEVRDEASLLLATLAQNGHADTALAQTAYQRGMQHLYPEHQGSYVVPQDWPLQLDKAFNRLDTVIPLSKLRLLEAMAHTISHDDQVNAEEAELLRTTCACLHCPLPPLLNT